MFRHQFRASIHVDLTPIHQQTTMETLDVPSEVCETLSRTPTSSFLVFTVPPAVWEEGWLVPIALELGNDLRLE